ncbi:MAG TPA: hypothetical protein VHH33_09480 [Nitrososphaeraceae archaeon]|jgi:hypothetical protein|nr:hypothetical protein [Nitrososphaeraceae archaeon]
MLNKHTFRKSVLLFTTVVAVSGSIAVALLSLNMSEANPSKWQDHKGLVFGAISSIQNNNQGEPAWVLSGHWLTNIINKTQDSFNQSNTAKFDSWIYMVMLNGSAMHKHALSNFSLSDISSQDNATSYKGTVTVTLKDGPVKEVPIEIKVMNNHVIALSLDATKTNNHFGDTPIYGIIPPKADIMKMMTHMGNKTKMDMQMNMSQ